MNPQSESEVGAAFGLAWVSPTVLVMNRQLGDGFEPQLSELWKLDLSTDRMTRVEVPAPEEQCVATDYQRPVRAGDDRVILYRWCHSRTFDPTADTSDVIELSLSDAEFTIISADLPNNPDTLARRGDQFLFSTTSGFCAGIARLGAEGREPWDVRVEGLRVDEAVFSQGCPQRLRAVMPTIAPDGTVAFFASLNSPVSGQVPLDAPYSLYMVGDGETEARELDVVVRAPQDLAWSPNGTRLAFSGDLAGRGEGLWLATFPGLEVAAVHHGPVHRLAWSPAGDRLAALVQNVDDAGQFSSRLLIFEV
jgi:hypothetical protein